MTRAREISNVLGRNIESTTFTATAGQTAFSITHAAGRIQVYMNGLLLDPTVDWTSDGSTVTLTEGAVAGDELEVVKHDNLAVADAIPRTGHTGTIDFSDATFTPPAGYIVQSVSDVDQAHSTHNTADVWSDTGLSVSITPKYANSKIHIHLTVALSYTAGGNSFALGLKRVQDGTTTYVGKGNAQSNQLGYNWVEMGSADTQDRQMNLYSHNLVDNASSTDAITYTFQLYVDNNTSTVTMNKDVVADQNAAYRSRGESTIICYEVAQ